MIFAFVFALVLIVTVVLVLVFVIVILLTALAQEVRPPYRASRGTKGRGWAYGTGGSLAASPCPPYCEGGVSLVRGDGSRARGLPPSS
jgi:hypothetical protein